jgi:hypothetical protein
MLFIICNEFVDRVVDISHHYFKNGFHHHGFSIVIINFVNAETCRLCNLSVNSPSQHYTRVQLPFEYHPFKSADRRQGELERILVVATGALLDPPYFLT